MVTKRNLFVLFIVVLAIFVSSAPALAQETDFQSEVRQLCALTPTEVISVTAPSGNTFEVDCTKIGAQPGPAETTVPNQPTGSGNCPQARDLGPWAPSRGQGEDFEVTASDAPESNRGSAGVVLGLWFPHGQTSWGVDEVTTFVPRGLSITVIDGAGRGWDYEGRCPLAEIKDQLNQHMRDRRGDTKYHGFVHIDELIRLELVTVRFDRRQADSDIEATSDLGDDGLPALTEQPALVTTPAPQGGQCKSVRHSDPANADGVTVTTGANEIAVVEAYGHSSISGDWTAMVGPNDSVTGLLGAWWVYSCKNIGQVISIEREGHPGKPIHLWQNGQWVEQTA